MVSKKCLWTINVFAKLFSSTNKQQTHFEITITSSKRKRKKNNLRRPTLSKIPICWPLQAT